MFLSKNVIWDQKWFGILSGDVGKKRKGTGEMKNAFGKITEKEMVKCSSWVSCRKPEKAIEGVK